MKPINWLLAWFFVRNTAMKSNSITYFEIDLDKEKYRAYRLDRDKPGAPEKDFLNSVQLPESHSILAIASATGSRSEEGIIRLRFLPSGIGEEVAIYMGPKGETPKATIIYSRYGGKAKVHAGEVEHRLEDPTWEELDILE